MNIINETVIHKAFGEGTVTGLKNGQILVSFNGTEKSFIYPDAFEKFIKFKNNAAQARAEEEIGKKRFEEEQKIQERGKNISIAARTKTAQKSAAKEDFRSDVAFKCTYCDGGKTRDNFGFYGACSDAVINHNIKTKHIWCSTYDSPCFRYYNKAIDREELDSWMEGGGSVCYESQLLRDWTFSAGVNHSGEKAGQPIKMTRARTGSLAVLTTRLPNTEEKDRIVFGVFITGEAYAGDDYREGFVAAHPDYRVKLSTSEANKIKFWNYYYNLRSPENIKWGTQLFRYLSEEQSAQILRDIVKVKKGTPDEDAAERIFNHYCEMKGFKAADIPDPIGGLLR